MKLPEKDYLSAGDKVKDAEPGKYPVALRTAQRPTRTTARPAAAVQTQFLRHQDLQTALLAIQIWV